MKEITIEDIVVLVATYNRANYLEAMLHSLFQQVVRPRHIYVLDNDSDDETPDMVAKYAGEGVIYQRTIGFLGNFKKAQSIVRAAVDSQYIVILHDDDIVHPLYLKHVINALNAYDDVTQVLTRYTPFMTELPMFGVSNERHYVFNCAFDLALHMLVCERIAYATAVYRREDFISHEIEIEKFGKYNDWPFMLFQAKFGKTILLDDEHLFFSRSHSGQDSASIRNKLSVSQILAWDIEFYRILCAVGQPTIGFYAYTLRYPYFIRGKLESFFGVGSWHRRQRSIEKILFYKFGVETLPQYSTRCRGKLIRIIRKIVLLLSRKERFDQQSPNCFNWIKLSLFRIRFCIWLLINKISLMVCYCVIDLKKRSNFTA